MAMRFRLALLGVILVLALSWLFFLVSVAPESKSHNQKHLRFPSSLEDLHRLADMLREYEEEAYAYLLLLFGSAYLFKQTFAVPGSVFMNVLAGAVFGLPLGFSLCCLLTAVGATCCFLLARHCGRSVALEYFPHRVAVFEKRLEENEHRLAYFLLFLRLFPMSPNWAINMCCGVLDVPIHKFFITVLVGLMPYNYICVQTGVLLTQLGSMGEVFSWSVLAQLSGVAIVALLPGLLQGRRARASKSGMSTPASVDEELTCILKEG